MRLRYSGGATVRLIGRYRFDKTNHYVQDVTEPNVIAELLTQPGESFHPVDPISPEEVERILNPIQASLDTARRDEADAQTPERSNESDDTRLRFELMEDER